MQKFIAEAFFGTGVNMHGEYCNDLDRVNIANKSIYRDAGRYNKYTTNLGCRTLPCIDARGQPNINLRAALRALLSG